MEEICFFSKIIIFNIFFLVYSINKPYLMISQCNIDKTIPEYEIYISTLSPILTNLNYVWDHGSGFWIISIADILLIYLFLGFFFFINLSLLTGYIGDYESKKIDFFIKKYPHTFLLILILITFFSLTKLPIFTIYSIYLEIVYVYLIKINFYLLLFLKLKFLFLFMFLKNYIKKNKKTHLHKNITIFIMLIFVFFYFFIT